MTLAGRRWSRVDLGMAEVQESKLAGLLMASCAPFFIFNHLHPLSPVDQAWRFFVFLTDFAPKRDIGIKELK